MKQVLRVVRGYLRTFGQYARSPKTRYEFKHYAVFLVLYILTVAVIWGGIYLYHGTR